MALGVTRRYSFRQVHAGVITADVYVGQQKIAAPGDAVEIGQLQAAHRTLCRLGGVLYWIENAAWGVG